MASATLIDGMDLNLWANRRESQGKLPVLLRRLIRATTAGIKRISLPSDEAIQLPGWDGIVITDEGNEYVPLGLSAWELGTNSDIKGKADKEYKKRTAKPGDVEPAETCFVFVTPRRWHGKESWLEEKRRESVWKDVQVYDGDDLASWLETAPGVHIWASVLLGKQPEGCLDLQTFWEEWASVTYYAIGPELIIASRQDAVSEIAKWLNGPPSVLDLQAETVQEAIAFTAAAFGEMPETERETAQMRAVVVQDPTAWRRLVLSDLPLILIPTFADRSLLIPAVKKGHHVLLPLGPKDASGNRSLKLDRPTRDSIRKALETMGVPQAQLEDLTTLARRSLSALRRRIALNPAVVSPDWASGDVVYEVLPALLAGRWADANPADREVLSKLAGVDYDQVAKNLMRWANAADPFIRCVGGTWLVVSPEDSWTLLSRYVTQDYLVKLESVARDVLGQIDPRYELAPDERFAAQIHCKILPHSNFLRTGLAETIAIMAAQSATCELADSATGQQWADRIVNQLFRGVNTWQAWASLSGQLMSLAEASPDVFLGAVDGVLGGDKPIVVDLFLQEENAFGSSPHVGLLWALELLAWSSDFFGRAVLQLAVLAHLDPGGKIRNRPLSSLTDIFLSWYPNTSATPEQRFKLLDQIRKREPQVAWALMGGILPHPHGTAMLTYEPHWRDWNCDVEPKLTYGELREAAEKVIERLLEDVGGDAGRWCSLIEIFPEMPGEQFNQAVEQLAIISSQCKSPDNQERIWNKLRDVIDRHAAFPDAEWVMNQERLERLRTLYALFVPSDPVRRHKWLFEEYPKLMRPEEQSWDERNAVLLNLRQNTVKEIIQAGGIEVVVHLATSVEDPWALGYALGTIEMGEAGEDAFLSEVLGSEDASVRNLAIGFVQGRVSKDAGWLGAKRQSPLIGQGRPAQQADFYCCLPFSRETWTQIEGISQEAYSLYWQQVNYLRTNELDETDLLFVLDELINARRLDGAVRFVRLCAKKGAPGFLLKAAAGLLDMLVNARDIGTMNFENIRYDLPELFNILEKSGQIPDVMMARLEWAYLPFLEHSSYGPRVLHRALASDPEFFGEVLKCVYKGRSEEPREQTPETIHMASLGFRILWTWRHLPGSDDRGNLEEGKLFDWVRRARELNVGNDRGAVGDQHIGQVLAHSLIDGDGIWPHVAVRNLVEEVASADLETGISIGVFNSIGVTVRNQTEGGEQERESAHRYRIHALACRDLWPRTSRLLTGIAEDFEHRARHEDLSSDLQQDLWR